MEIFATRQEIRRRMNARMGFTTNSSQAPLNLEQHNEFIRAAAAQVLQDCPWQNTMRETRVTVGIDQRFLNYPANATGSNILGVAYWNTDQKRYLPILRSRITARHDDEPLVDEGEPASVDNRGSPLLYEPKAQIEIWPRPDQSYELKIDHTVSPQMGSEDELSIVDAELIILAAMADAFEFQGDNNLAGIQRAKYDRRLRLLCNQQGAMPPIVRSSLRRMVRPRSLGYEPDSGAWPSEVPT